MSVIADLEKVLRRILAMRAVAGTAELVDTEIAQAQSLWQRMPPAPDGAKFEWPEDLRALAEELGFDREERAAQDRLDAQLDARLDEQIDARLDEQLVQPTVEEIEAGTAPARGLHGLTGQIEREIQGSVTGISDIRVTAAGTLVILTGNATDEVAKNRAGTVAAQLAPNATIDNRLVVAP